MRKIARQDAEETVDYSAYDEQLRRLVDKQVVGESVKESEGIYIVGELGKEEDYNNWSEEKTRNETDIIRTRIKKTIEQSLDDDLYAQKVLSELLKEIIKEAEALFDYPVKQYALFKSFAEKVDNREIEGMPEGVAKNDEVLGFMREVAHKAGLSKSQFTTLMTEIGNADVAKAQAGIDHYKTENESLKSEWGLERAQNSQG